MKYRKLDLRGAIAPFTLLEAIRAFRELASGDGIEILGDDGVTREDIFRVLRDLPHEVVDIRDRWDGFRILLVKPIGARIADPKPCGTLLGPYIWKGKER